MITFGYKSKFSGIIRALGALCLGIVMVVCKTNALEVAVCILAAFLIATGVVSLIVAYKKKDDGTMKLMGSNALVDIVLGSLLLMFPGFVAGLLIYLIGIALLGFGVFQIVSLASANRVLKVGVWAFIFPVLVVLAGGFLIMKPSFIGEAIGIVAGIALIVYGASELLSSWKMKKAIDEYEIHQTEVYQEPEEYAADAVKDVDYEKVDEQ